MTARRLSWIPKALGALLAAAIVIAAMAWLSGVFRSDVIQPLVLSQPSTAPAGTTFSVQEIQRLETVDLVGTVQSESRIQVSSRIQANILEMRVDAGSHVTQGQIIATLDDRDLKARLEQAKELLRAAEARADRAQRKTERLSRLVPQHAASVDELDDWASQLQAATAEVANLRQRVREAEVALSDAQIVSPIAGIVIERLADPGDMASPGKGLATIFDPSNLRLDAVAREAYIAQLEALRAQAKPIPVLIDSADKEFPSTITQIVPAADPQSRSFLVKAHLSETAGLYPGMFGRLRIPLREIQAIQIPKSFVRDVGQVSLVTVAEDHQTQTRVVRLGQTHGDQVEVLAGLSPGDRLIAPASTPQP